jgi:alkaline phosphatase D
MKAPLFTIYLLLISAIVFANTPVSTLDNLKNSKYHVVGIYPNPIQTTGAITLTLGEGSAIEVEFFDLTGKKVKELIKKTTSKGVQEIEFDARELKSGVYLCKISTSGWVEAKRFIIKH